MLTRRQLLIQSGLGLLGAAAATHGFTDARPDPPIESLPDGAASKGMITTETDTAIRSGLNYLANAWKNDGILGTRGYRGNVAVASLAGLAFLAAGSQPDRGVYGKTISELLRFILRHTASPSARYPGFIHNPNSSTQGQMYGHGFAALFLGEVYGMVHDPDLHKEVQEKLGLAVQLIVRSQNVEGGWRYYPYSIDADVSVTICQIMALRSARNCGFLVPYKTVKACIDYVKRCQDRTEGWFHYRAGGGRGPSHPFARTAAGVAALYCAGVYSDHEDKDAVRAIEMGLRYLRDKCKPGTGNWRGADMQYFYGHYYAAQAMWTAGGKWWSEWYPAIRDELLARQEPDGSWRDQICSHYATAMACVILQIPNNYLPILQK